MVILSGFSHGRARPIDEEKFVTALFFDGSSISNDVLVELENIDDEADVFEIRFVRIQDEKLAEDFSLEAIPSLVYFRGGIPIVYQGDLVSLLLMRHVDLINIDSFISFYLKVGSYLHTILL